MLGQLTRLIILSLIITFSLTSRAQTVVDSLKTKLVEADNLRDSISLLYHIYDSSPYSLKGKALKDIYELAISHEDYIMANDVLKRISQHYASNDSMQQVVIGLAEMLPDSPEKQSTLVYVNVMEATNQAKTLTKEQREAKLREYLGQHARAKNLDTYKRIEYLFLLCKYLSFSTGGDLLTDYLQELQTLVDSLPENDLPLKSLFYRQAANSYLANNMTTEAVEANKTLLKIFEKFENQYTIDGRTSHNYVHPTFTCYLNLLRCHDALSQDEVEEYYSKIIPLIESNPGLQSLSGNGKKPTIYYLMAKKRYAEAIPLIKAQLNDCISSEEEQLYMIEALLKAAESIGNKSELLAALEMSNDMLKERIENKAAESYKELQLIYEVNDLKQTNDKLVLTSQEIALNRHREQLTYSIISLVALVILLIVVFILYRRSKKLTSNLTKANELIIEERDALQHTQKEIINARNKAKEANQIKTAFINHMSHELRTPLEAIVEYSGLIADCADSEKRKYIKRFADVISLNTDLLLTLVNDVLDLPSLENAKGSVHIATSSVQNICKVAIDNVRRHIKPDIDLVFANEGDTDFSIMTDPHRVEQVLLNLLMNAAKFTDKGSITLQYTVSPKKDELTFTVTDTGIGIPQSKEEIIFSRSEKLNSATPGKGLGLYISRLLANMLGGSLTLDEDYRSGAKFIFTIPIS